MQKVPQSEIDDTLTLRGNNDGLIGTANTSGVRVLMYMDGQSTVSTRELSQLKLERPNKPLPPLPNNSTNKL